MIPRQIITKGQLFVRKRSPNDGLILRALKDDTIYSDNSPFEAEVVGLCMPDRGYYRIGEKGSFIASQFILKPILDINQVVTDNGTKLDIEGKATETQIGGNHYASMAIQPIEFIAKNNLDYFQGNVIKYVCRHEYKNGLEDLLKAKHYIDLLIQQKYK